MKHRSLFLLVPFLCAPFVLAQRSQPSPGVGNAVLLATNSIQIDRDSAVISGDVIVNRAPIGGVLGEAALSLDRGVTTPAGYKLAATSIDLDQGATAGGDVYYNTLTNAGTIVGTRFTPLALPVFASLPPALIRPAGSTNVSVADNGTLTLDEGDYGDVTVGKSARLTLSGGGYAFRSITVARGGELRYATATDVVVSGRADFGANAILSPAAGSGVTSAAMRMQVDGLNGTDGALLSTPPSIHAGQSAKLFATLYATGGSLVFEQDVEGNGAFLARDILVAHGGHFTINSAFNSPPSADPQTVFTNGTSPLQITLTGSDPEGSALTFSIAAGPTGGTLSSPVQASATSANVTYTPTTAGARDSFTFRVTDTSGATGDAIVTINPAEVDPPPTPTTVTAIDSSALVTKDIAATLLLRATAPTGVTVTFSISGSGPSHGSLGAVTGSTVVYTPAAGYTGPDAFQFQACGVISSVNVCSTAAFTITVQEPPADPPSIASDVRVTTPADTPVVISLGETSIQTTQRRIVAPKATTLAPAAVAGNVADSDADGFGDNANALPGSTPVFMSAGVNQSGGAGSNGTVRMQFEWDMANISGSIASLTSADVLLPTNRGTIDSLDTSFYWVTTSGDGALTNSDFESPAQSIAGAVMPVPPGMPIGSDGTFSFSVLSQLRSSSTFSFFAIQGRVDESLASSARGLQVRTTASGNQTANAIPTLALATSTVTQLSYRITALPTGGILRDSANQLITTVPYDLASPQVTYTPNTGFLGLDSFAFAVSNGVTSSSALAKITVFFKDCSHDVSGCNNGR